MFGFIKRMIARQDWQKLTKDQYAAFAWETGTSFIGSPTVATTISNFLQLELDFYGLYNQSELIAALPVWNNKVALGHKQFLKKKGLRRKVDFGGGELILPNKCQSLLLPFPAENVLSINLPEIHNLQQKKKEKYSCALARPISERGKKFRYNQSRSLKLFLEQGGEVFDINTLSPEEFCTHYHTLFAKRWGFEALGKEHTQDMLVSLKHMQLGKGLKINNKIVGLQLLFRQQNAHYDFYEYINAGIDPDYKTQSIGSILCYINLMEAEKNNRPFIYSFGYMDTDYKQMWCSPLPVYTI